MSQDQNKKSDTSNLVSISDLNEKLLTIDEEVGLRGVIASQNREIQKLQVELETKTVKIQHLEQMLTKMIADKHKPMPIIETDEQSIAEIQLKKLKSIAMGRDLTLEETRKFEIFAKIKNTHKPDDAINASYKILPETTQYVDLLQIAETTQVKKTDE